jgi:hypothetical protein
MYAPTHLANKPWNEIEVDLQRITSEYGPCDLVIADIDVGVPDERILAVVDQCKRWDDHQ